MCNIAAVDTSFFNTPDVFPLVAKALSQSLLGETLYAAVWCLGILLPLYSAIIDPSMMSLPVVLQAHNTCKHVRLLCRHSNTAVRNAAVALRSLLHDAGVEERIEPQTGLDILVPLHTVHQVGK